MNPESKNYLIGGGIGSMAAAAFMIRDGGVAGGNIYILEANPLMGGSLDGAGDAQRGNRCAGVVCFPTRLANTRRVYVL